MDNDVFEKKIYELAVYSLSAASGLINEPPAYGTMRVCVIIKDLVGILDEQGISSPRLNTIKQSIEELTQGSMTSEEDRKRHIDELVINCLDALD